jgi:hypothetical protein
MYSIDLDAAVITGAELRTQVQAMVARVATDGPSARAASSRWAGRSLRGSGFLKGGLRAVAILGEARSKFLRSRKQFHDLGPQRGILSTQGH